MKIKVEHNPQVVFSGIVKDLSPKWEEFYHDSATTMGDAIVPIIIARTWMHTRRHLSKPMMLWA